MFSIYVLMFGSVGVGTVGLIIVHVQNLLEYSIIAWYVPMLTWARDLPKEGIDWSNGGTGIEITRQKNYRKWFGYTMLICSFIPFGYALCIWCR